jgi:homoserine dehydrogenase
MQKDGMFMEKTIKISLMGLGNVSQAFVHLVNRKEKELMEEYGVKFIFTAIATGRHGKAINPQGLDANNAIELHHMGESIERLSSVKVPDQIEEFIKQSSADFMLENSPVNYKTGEPAVSHIRAALGNGIHAVSANKGPVVHAYHELTDLAEKNGVRFLFESAVMDGAPIFSVFREALPAVEINGFEGILNSCTNMILERMEEGESLDGAVTYAQSIGIAETDPSGDIDGWDAAIKVAAIATVLMGVPLKPQDIQREGIRGLSQTEIQQAQRENSRWKLVCRAERKDGHIVASVRPEQVPSKSPLYSVNGTSSFVVFHTDVLPGLGILESNPGPDTTAYGLLADILNILKTANR